MTIGTQDLETIRKEVASVQEFYTARMDKEIPPLKGKGDQNGESREK